MESERASENKSKLGNAEAVEHRWDKDKRSGKDVHQKKRKAVLRIHTGFPAVPQLAWRCEKEHHFCFYPIHQICFLMDPPSLIRATHGVFPVDALQGCLLPCSPDW